MKKKRLLNNKYKSFYIKNRDLENIVMKRFSFLVIIISMLMLILFINLYYIQFINKDKYKDKLKTSTEIIVEGSTAPRGRIYDRNGKLLVDNKPIKVIYYKKDSNITTNKEIEMSYQLANKIKINYNKLTSRNLKLFWIKNNLEKAKKKITNEEWKKLENRKLTTTDIENLKLERITDEDLSTYTDIDKEAAYIYYLMNNGYSYDEKIIKDLEVTDDEYAYIAANLDNLKGFNVKLDWERTYPYSSTFKGILGTVSSSKAGIPSNLKDYYLKKGYTLNDRVGTSYIEYQYDEYLKGSKNKYKLSNGKKELISEGTRGNDLFLTIDIDLQKNIEDIITGELVNAKNEPNTSYFNKMFVVVTNPKNGEVLAMVGKQIVYRSSTDYEILDYTPGVVTSSVVAGSVVKGASQITGYNTGALKIGEVRQDICVKLAATPIKCSWKNLGTLNDLSALQYSSNTYQFYTAMKVAGYNYAENGAFKMKNDGFKLYRETFKQFGLGTKTGIDLPLESEGVKGSNTTSGLLLDYSIGQYDTYTPLQLAQYMGTIANNGNRMQLHLLKSVSSSKDDKKVIYNYEPVLLNKVDTRYEYINRVKEGFKLVLSSGTGANYMNINYKPAGKTGTSQSFIDTNFDGKVDTETLTNTFAGYAPYDDPKVVFTILSPDISDNNSKYTSSVNKRVTRLVSDKYFEMYGI